MVAVGLTVLMMTMVVTVFGLVMDSIRESRGSIEITDRLRAVRNRLQADLENLTAPLTPPLDPDKEQGYFELIEGPIGPVIHPTDVAKTDIPDSTDPSGFAPDTTVGDLDDILMFTIRSGDEPFVGRMPLCNYDTTNNPWVIRDITYMPVQSRVAEVAWFVRGNTLYRRTLLVATPDSSNVLPTVQQLGQYYASTQKSFWDYSDLSVHLEPGSNQFVANTLGDLTRRECRYAHQPFAWPYDARMWGSLGLPTLEECSGEFWGPAGVTTVQSNIDPRPENLIVPLAPPNFNSEFKRDDPTNCPRLQLNTSATAPFDAWRRPHPASEQNPVTGQIRSGTRVGEDVILTNVLSFDVKVWDPGAPIIQLADPSTTVNADAIQPGDPPIREPDGKGGFYDWPAIIYALNRVGTPTGGSDLDRIIGFGAYVDLNYLCRMGPNGNVPNYDPLSFRINMNPRPDALPEPFFHHSGDFRSGLFGTLPQFAGKSSDITTINRRASVYDTYSTHYESDGINQGNAKYGGTPWRTALADDAGINGIDDDNDGAVDEKTAWPDTSGENETAPPYAHPLRGIQIKIRVFEPDTRQIREVTLEHEFIPQ